MRRIVALILIFTLFLSPTWSGIASATENNLTWNGPGENLIVKNNDVVTITRTASGSLNVPANTTITIVGSVKSNAPQVLVNVGLNSKVRWGATYCGKDNLIYFYGSGEFEIIDGALIENITGANDTLIAHDDGLITMNGGTMRVKGKNGSSIFSTMGDVVINGGLIEDFGKNGCCVLGRNVTVNGGKILARGKERTAIMSSSSDANGNFDPYNINYGNVMIYGGTVSCSSESFYAISAYGWVNIYGGTVSSTSLVSTITAGYNEFGGIRVSGGIITNTRGDCLLSNNTSVTGGVVTALKGYAISSDRDDASFSSLSTGTAQTMAYSNDRNDTSISFLSTGTAQTMAYSKAKPKSKAKVTGGLVLAKGDKVSQIINTKNVKLSTSKGKGIICSWTNKKSKAKYTRGTKTHLKVHTKGATVKWDTKNGKSGLSFAKGSNKGFVRIKGVTVENPKPKKSQFTYSLKSKKADGKRKSVKITAKKGVGKIKAVYYTGIDGTKYKKSTKAPKKAGTYKVTVTVAKGTKYKAIKGLYLGKYEIKKASKYRVWFDAINISLGKILLLR